MLSVETYTYYMSLVLRSKEKSWDYCCKVFRSDRSLWMIAWFTGCGGIELCFGGDCVLDLHQAAAHRLHQALSQWGQDHSASRRNQQFIPKIAPQAGKSDACCRLAQVKSFAGARNTPFGQQSIQGNEQSNVEICESPRRPQIFKNKITIYIKYSFYK
jgi:hypothetical protein